MEIMKLLTRAITLSFLCALTIAPAALGQSAPPTITGQEAHSIGVDAYVFLFPLVLIDISRNQFTIAGPGKEFVKALMNMFFSDPQYPPANFKGVVRSNFDTLYSIAGLDI